MSVAIPDNSLIAFKAEATRGTYLAPTSFDADIKFKDIQVNLVIGEQKIKYQGTNHAHDPSVFNKAHVEITATTEIKGSGTAGTAPKIAKIFKMLGMTETVVSSTSVTYQRDRAADCGNTYSCCINDMFCDGGTLKQTRLPVAGVMCESMVETTEDGGVRTIVCVFKGKLNGVPTDETALIEYTGFDTTTPPTHLGGDVTLGGVTQQTNTETINYTNELQMETDWGDGSGSGYSAAFLSAFETTVEIAPYSKPVADEDTINEWRLGTTLVYSSVSGTIAGNIVTFSAAAFQRLTVGRDDGDGGITAPTTGLCTGYPPFTLVFT